MVAIDLITEHIRMKLQQHDLRRIYHNLEVTLYFGQPEVTDVWPIHVLATQHPSTSSSNTFLTGWNGS